MARQQPQPADPARAVAPTATGLRLPGASVGPQPAAAPGLRGLAQFSASLTELTHKIADDRKDRLRNEAKALVQQSGSIVDRLVNETVAGEDPTEARERVARAMRRAQAAGIIKTADDPFFRTELLVVSGERLALGVRERVKVRLSKGENLDRVDENGDTVPGVSFETIWNEEAAKAGGATVMNSGLAARAFGESLKQSRAALEEAAAQSSSDHEVAELARFRQDQITSSAAAAATGSVEEQDALFVTLQTHIDEIYASNIPDARDRTLDAILDAADYVALDDPDRARQMLTMAGGKIMVVGRPMEKDPVLSVQLAEARLELTDKERRNSAAASGVIDDRRRTRTRELEEQIGRTVEDHLSSGNYTPLQARDLALRELRASLADDEDRGALLQPLTNHLDALVSDRTSNPRLVEEIQSSIDLADNPEDLELADALIDAQSGEGLFGTSVSDLKKALRDRRDILNGASLATDNTYAAGKTALARLSAPDTLPTEARTALEEQLTQLRREYTNEAFALASTNGGRPPFKLMSEAALAYEKRAKDLVIAAESGVSDAFAEAHRAAERGDRRGVLAFSDRLGAEAISRLHASASDVALTKQRIAADDEIRQMERELGTHVALTVQDQLGDNATTALISDMNGRLRSAVKDAIEAAPPGTDIVDLRELAVNAAKTFDAAEREARKDEVAKAVIDRAKEDATPTDLAEARDRAERYIADRAFAQTATAETAPVPFTLDSHPGLQGPNSRLAAKQINEAQSSAYYRGFWSVNRTTEEARAAVLPYVRAATRGNTENPGTVAIAALAPLGITVDEVLGKSILLPPLTGEIAKNARYGTNDPIIVKIDPTEIPVWSTTFFGSEKELNAFEKDERSARFFKALGIAPEQEDDWVVQQYKNIRRLNTTRTR